MDSLAMRVYATHLMLPNNAGAVAAVLLAIVPGFVATSVWARARTWKGPSGDLRMALQSLVLSAIVQLLLAPLTVAWIYPVRDQIADFPERVATWFALAVLVVPVAAGLVGGWLTNSLTDPGSTRVRGRLRRGLAHLWPASAPPSIWDWLFTVNPPYGSFLVIEFRDGRKVAGVFAEGSLALTSPEPRGLFLISEWEMDESGAIVREVPATRGIMLHEHAEIRWVRVLRSGEEVADDGREGHSQEGSGGGAGEGAVEAARGAG
jgi:hypothetical protein